MSKPTKRKFSENIDRNFIGEVKIDPTLPVPEFEIIYGLRKDRVEVGDLVISHSYLFGNKFDTGHAAIIARKLDAQGREVPGEKVAVGGVMSGITLEPIERQHEINAIIRFKDKNIKDLLGNFATTAATNPGEYSVAKISRMWWQELRSKVGKKYGEQLRESKIYKYDHKIQKMTFVRMLREGENIEKEAKKIEDILDGKNPISIERSKIERIGKLKNDLSDSSGAEDKLRLERRIRYLSRSLKNGSIAKQERLIEKEQKKLASESQDVEGRINEMEGFNVLQKSWNREKKSKLESRLKEINKSSDELVRELEIIKEEKVILKNELAEMRGRQQDLSKRINKFRTAEGFKPGSKEEDKIKKESLTVFCSHVSWIILQAALASNSKGKVPEKISDAPGTIKPSGILERFVSIERLSGRAPHGLT